MAEPINKVRSNESVSSMTTDTTMSTNPWGQHQPGPGLDSTGWSVSPDWEDKIKFLRTNCENGFCYIWLILTIQQFIDMTLAEFTTHVTNLKESCGANPVSKDMMNDFILYMLSNLQTDDTISSLSTMSISMINHMMTSKVRLHYGDNGASFHITPSSGYAFGCSCTEVYCEHGWAPRFIITMLTTSSKHIGATINFDDIIFDDNDDQSFITASKDPMDEMQPLFPKKENAYPTISNPKESAEEQWDRIRPSTMKPDPPKRMPTIDEIDAYANLTEMLRKTADSKDEIQTFGGKEKSSVREQLKTRIDKLSKELDSLEFPEDLEPQDSSSNFGRRENMIGKYLRPGTQLTMSQPQSNDSRSQVIESQALVSSNNLRAQNPIVGYQKTTRMLDKEQESIAATGVINGLAQPLKNERLLLLMHLHTAFNTIKVRIDDPENLKDGLVRLIKASPRTQSERLLSSVLNSTFDVNSMEVIANGYNLPYIEIGMRVSSAQMAKCFTMLAMEYEITWFQEFKGLRVPDFHSRFYSISERDPNTTSRVSTKHRKPRSKPPRSKAGSLLSYMTT